MSCLAYIPARGGSKGILKKNIVDLHGEPLLAWTIRAAKESELFDMVFVSTDSEEIAEVARSYGAEVPFLRLPEFAQDSSKTIDAVYSDKCRFEALGRHFDTLCLLQATSPFRTATDIRGAMALYRSCGEGVVSISPVEENPILMRTRAADARLTNVLKCSSTIRRQDMPAYYKVNGAIYINAWEEITPSLSLNDNPFGYVMEQKASLDIDTKADLEVARQTAQEAGK